MKIKKIQPWNLSIAEAKALQIELRSQVALSPPEGFNPKLVAGADVSCNRFSKMVFASVVVVSLPDLKPIETATAASEAKFPYIPGLLAFREIPAVAEAFSKLRNKPDAVIFDGHGSAHPRRMGLATHAGIILDCPTLGCAKSLLIGNSEEDLSKKAGAHTPILHNGETIGAALRTKENVNPLYISPGHKMDLETAINLTLACSAGYRLPEPTRLAHIAANELRKEFGKKFLITTDIQVIG